MQETTRQNVSPHGGAGWQAETWRLTAFLTPGEQVGEPQWWTELAGESPESRNSSPRQGTLHEQGPYKGGILSVSLRPGRVDLVISATPRDEASMGEDMPSLGLLSDSIETFRHLAVNWLAQAPSTNRLAVGNVLMRPVEDRNEAYQLVAQYVPGLRLDSENISDLIYRINRSRNSKVRPDLLINRVSSWSAIVGEVMTFEIPTAQTVQRRQLFVAARVELDINTAPETSTELDRADLHDLLDEMIQLDLEIAERGDVP